MNSAEGTRRRQMQAGPSGNGSVGEEPQGIKRPPRQKVNKRLTEGNVRGERAKRLTRIASRWPDRGSRFLRGANARQIWTPEVDRAVSGEPRLVGRVR